MTDHFDLLPWVSFRGDTGNWYKVVQYLGGGGSAVTALTVASDGDFRGSLFAMKVFRRVSMPERRKQFIQERDFLKWTNHPCIMQTYDQGVYRENHPFFLADYLPQTLYNRMRAGQIGMVEKLSISVQLLSALTHLENETVVHRDIKPQNIFLKGKSCVLGDFGLMKRLGDSSPAGQDREFFRESLGPGMPWFYRTPDLVSYARGEGPISTKSDVFQLGLVLTELFTGRNPGVRPRTHYDDVELEEIEEIPGKYGRGIETLLRRMLRFDPTSREPASRLIDPWMGMFRAACIHASEREGHAF